MISNSIQLTLKVDLITHPQTLSRVVQVAEKKNLLGIRNFVEE